MADNDQLETLNAFLERLNQIRTIALEDDERARPMVRRWTGQLGDYLRRNVSDREADEVDNIVQTADTFAFEDIIDTIDELKNHLSTLIPELPAAIGSPQSAVKAPNAGRRVFVVHGHDGGRKDAVARLLEKLGLVPVILHEQPNQGRTLIEKFEHYADVGFAVVILTADDVGRAKIEKDDRPRARQNVILELGFFLGKLGRDKVCPLLEPGVEEPSDLRGIVYTRLEGDDWKIRLVKELQAAGYKVSADQIP